MGKRIFLILGDQLSGTHPFLRGRMVERDDLLLMIESLPRAGWLPYHPQKLLYMYACMRRFAHGVRADFPDIPFEYVRGSADDFATVINSFDPVEVHVVEPSEVRARTWLRNGLKAKLVFHPNPFFLAGEDFLPAKPPYLLENFYRKMRVHLNVLMENGGPEGGQWNFDSDNRKPPDRDLEARPPKDFLATDWCDDLDLKIYAEVDEMLGRFIPSGRFGSRSRPTLPTHHRSAREFLSNFISHHLNSFGAFEDAMVAGAAGLFHSGLSPLMNIQILSASEIVEAVAAAPRSVPLASREGFIRQVIGWREFIRLIFNRHSEEYARSNFFGFSGSLPPLYWGIPTRLNCLSDIILQVREHAYSHHITRLMVLGNFALLTQTNPHEVNEWFWSAYLDAYEWVVTPNVLGMSQFADGGVFATKPYVSGANYINRMSNYCKSCKFDPKKTVGADACPFNSLYWDFVAETQRLKVSRPSFARRMGMMWSVWNKKSEDEKNAIRAQAEGYRILAREGKL